MIRSAKRTDAAAITAIAEETGLFQAAEVVYVREMLKAYFAGDLGDDHHWVVVEEDGEVIGVAYYAQEDMGPGTWNLLLLAVRSDRQSGGRGQALVRHVEQTLAGRGERVLLIETSSGPKYDRTRAFYERLGYEEEARIRDFYAAGDDKVVFWKAL